LPAGNTSGVFYFRGYKAESLNLVATALAAMPSSSASVTITVQPAAYSQLQVLFPNQVTDPGKPNSNSTGHTGTPNSVVAGNFVTTTVNAVDAYFNLVASAPNDTVTFTTSDAAAPAQGSAILASGTLTHPDIFVTTGSQTVTVTDLSTAFTGFSDPIGVMPGPNSTLLNVVHASPNLSTIVGGQAGVVVMTFSLNVQNGGHPIQINSFTLDAQDQTGAGVAMNSAFQDLVLTGAPTPVTFAAGSGTSATFAGPITVFVPPTAPLTLTLTADIASAPTAKTVKLSLAANGITGQDAIIGPSSPVGTSSFGDSTGFPMDSSVMLFEKGDVASTYGNYPNPFRAGFENTTIEFYLSATSTVSLVLYDVMGQKTATLLDHQNLPAGLQRVPWNGHNGFGNMVLNGIYYAQLDVNGSKYLLKIAVVK
jgi:hypothetical protein